MTDWSNAKEVLPEYERKKCQGEGCPDYFKVVWKDERRCARCRAEKRPYKDKENPF